MHMEAGKDGQCKFHIGDRQLTHNSQFIEVYCNRLVGGADGLEISGIAYDTSTGQLAVVQRSESVHRFIVDPSMRPVVVKSIQIPQHWPQAVCFGQTGVGGPEIWSFGREDGIM